MKVYLIITTCINNKVGLVNYEERKARYLHCIPSAVEQWKSIFLTTPIIVENTQVQPTYLNDIKGANVIYTQNNTNLVWHKGRNELLDIKEVIKQLNIEDNDIVIKLTGRYKVLDNYFFKLINDNLNSSNPCNAFAKFYNVCTQKYTQGDCVLGLIATRCKFWKEFNYANNVLSPEVQFARYIHTRSKGHVIKVDNLGLECCFADDHRIIVV